VKNTKRAIQQLAVDLAFKDVTRIFSNSFHSANGNILKCLVIPAHEIIFHKNQLARVAYKTHLKFIFNTALSQQFARQPDFI